MWIIRSMKGDEWSEKECVRERESMQARKDHEKSADSRSRVWEQKQRNKRTHKAIRSPNCVQREGNEGRREAGTAAE